MLATDFMLQGALKLLEQVRDKATATGPHDRSQRHQRRRKESDHAADRAQRAHAETSAESKPRRLFNGHQQADCRSVNVEPPGGTWSSAATRPCV